MENISEEQNNPNPATPPHSTLIDNNSKILPLQIRRSGLKRVPRSFFVRFKRTYQNNIIKTIHDFPFINPKRTPNQGPLRPVQK